MLQKLRKEFFRYVSLNVMGMIGLSCYILADTFFVANGIGINGLASLNLSISVYSVVNGIGLLIGIGGASQFAIYKASNNNKTNHVFTNAIYIALVVSLLLVIIGIFGSSNLATILGANETTFTMTTTYIKTILCFAPFFILNTIGISFVRNDGNPSLAMIAMLVGSLSNIILDYYFIFALNMGMFGAAFATGLAPIISLCILSIHYFKKKNTFSLIKCSFQYYYFKKILGFGNASFIMEVSSSIILIVFNLLLLSLSGTIAVASYGIIANIALVITSIFTGIGNGIQPMISTYFATQRKDALFITLRYAITLAIVITIIIYSFIFLQSSFLIGLFNNEGDATLFTIATTGLHIYCLGFFVASINIVMITYFSAISYSKQAFFISICRTGILLIPFAFVLSSIFGIIGLWLSFVCSELCTLLFIFYLVKRNKDILSLNT